MQGLFTESLKMVSIAIQVARIEAENHRLSFTDCLRRIIILKRDSGRWRADRLGRGDGATLGIV